MNNYMSKSSNTAMQQGKPKFSAMINTQGFQKALTNSLKNPREIQKFTAAITSVVSTNPELEKCDAGTILSAALCGHSLGLPPSPQLGQYYIVPFNDRKNNRTVATFVLGYRGYIQLAIRSGQYKRLNVIEIKEGELLSWNPLTEEIEVNLISDEAVRTVAKTIGYYACFSYINGFEKAIYWSKEKMEQHATRYSAGYKNDVKNGTSYTFWAKSFDDMAKKTMLRQLISKWGVMSVEMQNAFEADTHAINEDGSVDYDVSEEYSVEPAADDDIPPFNDDIPSAVTENDSFSIDDFAE